MICFVYVTDLILESVMIKDHCSASKNLTKIIKLHQFLKKSDQIEAKKNRRPT